jgi:uncharacterized protein (DUF1499 family)
MLYLGIALGVTAVVLTGLSLASRRRPALGPVAGSLRPCGGNPNCVCSQQPDQEHFIAPLECRGEPTAEFRRLRGLVDTLPRTRLIDEQDGYLHYEFVSRLVRYVDDVEFLLDSGAGVIHVRSASRVGRSDLGANRARIEELRSRFARPAPD